MPREKMEITEEMSNTVITMYQDGCSVSAIEKAIGHCDSIVYRILKENNIDMNRKNIHYTDEQIEKIKVLREQGFSYDDIAKEIGVGGRSKIYDTLKKLGLTNSYDPNKIMDIIDAQNKHQGNRKYFFDEHIFDEINTPDKAYCIGLFMADGCNQPQNTRFSIELQERDRDILDKISLMFQSDYPLQFRDSSSTKTMTQSTYKFAVQSKYFCNRLSELGIVPKKSLILEYPKYIPSILIPYLIKGYIDGDGWVQQYNIGFMSTYNFCLGVKEYLETLQIKSTILDPKRHYNENTKILYITGKNNIVPLAEIMYSHGNLFLERKRNKFIEFGYLNNTNNSQTS